MGTEIIEHTDDNISSSLLQKINSYWRAANYVSVGQIYLRDNPLLKEPFQYYP